MSAAKPGVQFDFEWRITLFTLVMVPLMVSLGYWQLQRAEEKAFLASSFEKRQQQRPASLSQLWDKSADTLAYAPVQVQGTFSVDAYFLLDNQVQNKQVGYEVLGILTLDDGSGSVLINRGWIAGDPARRSLPAVSPVEGPVSIEGHIYVAPGEPYLLAEQELDGAWPLVVQAVEMEKLLPAVEAQIGGPVFRYPVRIDKGEPGALSVSWQVVNMSPQKHQGYALQWFVMAAVLLVFFLLSSSNLWQLLSGSVRVEE